jgi:hypothetical protein
MIKSKAWQDALLANKSSDQEDLYASTEPDVVGMPSSGSTMTTNYDERYANLVSRAYFKIITEAEKADARIAAEYALMQAQKSQVGDEMGRSFKKRYDVITKKYKAHTAMLEGLKSWNIFSPNRSGDLDYFKAENDDIIREMMQNGASDEKMVNLLIYKLADLYHNEQ